LYRKNIGEEAVKVETFNVSIYIETSIHGAAANRSAGMYLVEFITKKEIPITRTGWIKKDVKTTENAMTLTLIRDALSILTKPCCIRVNTRSAHILNVMQNHWLPQWKKNGWRNAKGNPVANQELWQQVSDLMDNHYVEFVSENHSYRMFMEEEIRKAVRTGKQ